MKETDSESLQNNGINPPVSHEQADTQIAAAERENDDFKRRTAKIMQDFNSVPMNQGKE